MLVKVIDSKLSTLQILDFAATTFQWLDTIFILDEYIFY